mmetsp:Transcript_5297/g.17568  ORF Transcript_5297/g.17568 Transcript_5297/m.17568 type:complete len:205 (+) Transcript_5297:426-1040(+)
MAAFGNGVVEGDVEGLVEAFVPSVPAIAHIHARLLADITLLRIQIPYPIREAAHHVDAVDHAGRRWVPALPFEVRGAACLEPCRARAAIHAAGGGLHVPCLHPAPRDAIGRPLASDLKLGATLRACRHRPLPRCRVLVALQLVRTPLAFERAAPVALHSLLPDLPLRWGIRARAHPRLPHKSPAVVYACGEVGWGVGHPGPLAV